MSSYSSLEQILHRQFLGDNSLSNFLFERLHRKAENISEPCNSSHVFVTGLARSGTTSLLNKLYASNYFGSLLYKYMPFILSPSIVQNYLHLFNKNLNRSENDVAERFHKDGILFGKNSPECLDEVFWLKTFSYWYKSKNLSIITNISEKTLSTYEYFLDRYASIQLKERMLIKNNNHHLRLVPLAKRFAKSKFLVLFRDPLSHSLSLLNQHKNFLSLHKKDEFIMEYMNLVGHREFGPNIAPFIYPTLNGKSHLEFSNLSLEYWISQWIGAYSWLLTIPLGDFSNISLISYEMLCTDPNTYKRICSLLSVSNTEAGVAFRKGRSITDINQLSTKCNELLLTANEIYSELKSLAY